MRNRRSGTGNPRRTPRAEPPVAPPAAKSHPGTPEPTWVDAKGRSGTRWMDSSQIFNPIKAILDRSWQIHGFIFLSYSIASLCCWVYRGKSQPSYTNKVPTASWALVALMGQTVSRPSPDSPERSPSSIAPVISKLSGELIRDHRRGLAVWTDSVLE